MMANLSDYRLLCFDVYGTLIDYETGVIAGLGPLLSQLSTKPSKVKVLEVCHDLEKSQQVKTPDMQYAQLLTEVYPQFAARFDLKPSSQDAEAFGRTIGTWSAFPDTVDALRRLSKQYKLVVLSNVDRQSFSNTNAGPLEGVKFDKIITAQDVGSYKPNLRNFEYMLKAVKEDFGIEKDQILSTAQSQFHDHQPTKKMSIKSVWIERGGTMGNAKEQTYDWKFLTLGQMADQVEKDAGDTK